jgi:hypothetical protein
VSRLPAPRAIPAAYRLLLSTTPASAASYWNSVAPANATWRKMISNTTCTDAHRSIHKYGYKACAKAPGLGGTPAVCTSARFV